MNIVGKRQSESWVGKERGGKRAKEREGEREKEGAREREREERQEGGNKMVLLMRLWGVTCDRRR